ncbi:MAG: NAD(P)-dependent oxidoreductase [Gammaproteobacteria bacterium]|nr:NAD(P)-dependent oxidoreductase [Gammaproteobacteria bacterium]
MSKKSSILLTGATGFLGSHILDKLVENGYNVAILKRSWSDTWRIDCLIDQIKIFNLDLISLEEIFQSIKPEYVIHLATLYSKFDSGADMDNMYKSNVSFPADLLEIGAKYGLKGFINTGTFFEYDCTQQPINENNPIKPFNLYAQTKLDFELILKSYSEKMNINTFRIFSPYGERDNNKLIPMLIQKALSKQTIQLSDGMQKLDFIYALDVADAYIGALKVMLLKENLSSYNVYNLGSGIPISVREVVSVVEQNLGEHVDVVWGDPSTVDIPIAYADLSKIKKELSWFPSYSIHQGMANTIEYYRNKEIG